MKPENSVVDINIINQYKLAFPSLVKISKNLHHSKYHPRFFNPANNEMLENPMRFVASCIFDENNQAYELHEVLGRSAFGIVKKGVLSATDEVVAVKIQNITAQIDYQTQKFGDITLARDYVFNQIKIEDEILKLNNMFISSVDRKNASDVEKHYTIMKFIPEVITALDRILQDNLPEKSVPFSV